MSTALWGWPVFNDPTVSVTPTYSGGTWSGTLPLTNLSDRRLANVARSSSAAVGSPRFQVDLKTARAIGLLAIPKHTISSAGKVRARGFSSPQVLYTLDFSGWSSVGTPTRSAASVTGTDGVPLDLIGDDSGAALEGYTFALTGTAAWTGDAQKIVVMRVKQGTSTSSVIRVRDTTASANRLLQVIAWAGSVPSITQTTGTLVDSTLVDSGIYRLVFLTTSVTAANSNQVEFYPATTGALATANTGDIYAGDLSTYDLATEPLVYDAGYSVAWPAGLTAEDLAGSNYAWVHVPTATQSARYWGVDVYDPTNAAGYVDLARLIVAGRYQPTVNLMPGSGQGLEDLTTRNETDGGAAIFTVRSKRRNVIGTLDEMQEAEMFTSFWKMQKQLGISGQFFFMWDSADTTYKHDRAFLAVFKQLDPITMAAWPRYRAPFQIIEEI